MTTEYSWTRTSRSEIAEVAAKAAEAGREAEPHRVDTGVEGDRDGRGSRLGGKGRGRAAREAHWAAVYANKDFVEGFASKFRPLLMTQEVKLLQAAPWGPHP